MINKIILALILLSPMPFTSPFTFNDPLQPDFLFSYHIPLANAQTTHSIFFPSTTAVIHDDDSKKLYKPTSVQTVTVANSTYALVGSHENAVTIFNITNPVEPIITATIPIPSPINIETFILDDATYAVISSWDNRIIHILDITDPENPNTASIFTDLANGSSPHGPDLSDGEIVNIGSETYYIVSVIGENAVQIINITDPQNPSSTSIVYRSLEFPGLLAPSGLDIITVADSTFVIVASSQNKFTTLPSSENGIQIINVTNPKAPSGIWGCCLSNSTLTDARQTDIEAVEINGHLYAIWHHNHKFRITNITDFENPNQIQQLQLYAFRADIDILTVANSTYALISEVISNEIKIIDISDPLNPNITEIINSDTYQNRRNYTASDNGTGYYTTMYPVDNMDIVTISSNTYVISTVYSSHLINIQSLYDSEPPIIHIAGSSNITIPINGDLLVGTSVTDNDPAYSATASSNTSDVNFSKPGTYLIEYTAPADARGNIPVPVILTLTIDPAPIIKLLGPFHITVPQFGIFVDPGAIVSDNDPSYNENVSSNASSINMDILGTYTIVYTAPPDALGLVPANVTRLVKVAPVVDSSSPPLSINHLDVFNTDDPSSKYVAANEYMRINIAINDTITSYMINDILGLLESSWIVDVYDKNGKTNNALVIDVQIQSSVIEKNAAFNITVYHNDGRWLEITQNDVTVNRTVFVDTVPPNMSLYGENNTMTILHYDYADPGAAAEDESFGIKTIYASVPLNTSMLGMQTLEYTVSDKAGNTVNITRTVTIKPLIHSLIIQSNNAHNTSYATIDDLVTVTLVANTNITTFNLGRSFLFNYVATNYEINGNTITVSRTVTVDIRDRENTNFYIYLDDFDVTLGNDNLTGSPLIIDKLAPYIGIQGYKNIELLLGMPYVEYGAIAHDTSYGFINATISGSVDVQTLGVYHIVYSAPSDYAGNTPADKIRIVNIVSAYCGQLQSAYNILNGTDSSEILTGTDGNDLILGNGGNDEIHGLGGNDCIYGGGGNDIMYGDLGNDTMHGDDGMDTIIGDEGFDQMYGGNGDDQMHGGDDGDTMYGGDDYDVMNGDLGDDLMYGNGDDDHMSGNRGDDQMHGGDGYDIMYGNIGSDLMHGGEGNDEMNGDRGDDEMHGDDGYDTMYGGDDEDMMYGGKDADIMHGNFGNDRMNGNRGADTMYGNDGNDVMSGDKENDAMYGGAGNDKIKGKLGNDRLYGEDGNDKIYGNQGVNTVSGGLGDDVCIVSSSDTTDSCETTNVILVDIRIPVKTNLAIHSSNSDASRAKTGDILNITLATDEALSDTTVYILGRNATYDIQNNTIYANIAVESYDSDNATFSITAYDPSLNALTVTESHLNSSNIFIDNTPPVIDLHGSDIILVHAGNVYTDTNVTVRDNDPKYAGSVTSNATLVGTSDGTYIIVYSASPDPAGNEAENATRTVIVSPPLEIYNITINTTNPNPGYAKANDTLVISLESNMNIENASVSATVFGRQASIIISNQTLYVSQRINVGDNGYASFTIQIQDLGADMIATEDDLQDNILVDTVAPKILSSITLTPYLVSVTFDESVAITEDTEFVVGIKGSPTESINLKDGSVIPKSILEITIFKSIPFESNSKPEIKFDIDSDYSEITDLAGNSLSPITITASDGIGPLIKNAMVVSSNQIEVYFDEDVQFIPGTTPPQFLYIDGFQTLISSNISGNTLSISQILSSSPHVALNISFIGAKHNIEDTSGNSFTSSSILTNNTQSSGPYTSTDRTIVIPYNTRIDLATLDVSDYTVSYGLITDATIDSIALSNYDTTVTLTMAAPFGTGTTPVIEQSGDILNILGNSVNLARTSTQDLAPPVLVYALSTTKTAIILTFSEPITAPSASPINYVIIGTNMRGITQISPNHVLIYTSPFINAIVQTAPLSSIQDFSGNIAERGVNHNVFKISLR